MVVDLGLTRRQSNNTSSDSASPLSIGAIVGIACGVGALLIVVVVLFIMYWRRQRRFRQEDEWVASGGADGYQYQYPVGAYPAGITPMTHSGPFYTMDYKMDRVKCDSPQTQSPEKTQSWQTLSFPGDKSIDQMASAMPTHPAYIPRTFVRPSTSPPAGSPTASFMISNINRSMRQPQAPVPAIYEPEYVKIPVALKPVSTERSTPQAAVRSTQSSKLPALIIPTQARFMRAKRTPIRESNLMSTAQPSSARMLMTISSSGPQVPIEHELPKYGAGGNPMSFRDRAGSLVHSVSLGGPSRERPLSIHGNVIHHAPDQPRDLTEADFGIRRHEDAESASGDSDAIFG